MVKWLMIIGFLFGTELLYFALARRQHIVDTPNGRSSHHEVVLRGGGVLFVVANWLYLLFFGTHYLYFSVGLILVGGISFWDDVHSVSYRMRLLVQIAGVCLLVYGWQLFQGAALGWIPFVILGAVGILNAFNFMDGINGLTGAYALAVALPLLLLNHRLQFMDSAFIEMTIVSVGVFLWYNFRKHARCFAGDVGAVGIAFTLLFMVGNLIRATGDFTYLLLFVVYGVDSGVTIVHRILLHEPLQKAHRKHTYQLMANELGLSHRHVALRYMALQLAVSGGLVALTHYRTLYFIGVCGLLTGLNLWYRRKYYYLHRNYLEQ